MSNSIYIQDYSLKTFIVRGETKEYKNSLKTLGGKWNPMLTDKETGQKFGGWIFFSEKRSEIEEWIKNCRKDTFTSSKAEVSCESSKIDKIYNMLEAICKFHNIKI